MKKIQRLLSALLVLCMVMTLSPTTAWATDSDFTIDENGVLTKYNGAGGDVTISERVLRIGENAFSSTGISSVTIPSSVTTIDSGAFSYCQNLTAVFIPKSVNEICYDAFKGCSLDIYYEGTETDWERIDRRYSNDYSHIATMYYNSTEIGNGTGEASNTCGENLTWELENGTLTINGTGAMKDYGAVRAPWYNQRDTITTVIIAEGVTSIGKSAFSDCSSLTKLVIPSSVNSIGGSIDGSCFEGCTGLTSAGPIGGGYNIEFDWAGNTSFGFSNCYSLTTVTIPNGVEYIDSWAFYGCSNLTTVIIPDTVRSFGRSAFYGCKISDVYYSGNEEQWAKITRDDYVSLPITGDNIHYNSTGPVTPDPGPDAPSDNYTSVYFLSGWDAATRKVQFGDSALISPDTYTVADNVDVSNISSLLNKYVLVTMEQGDSSLEYTITDIQPVESRIGTVSATGEHSLTIDGTTYPVRQNSLITSGMYDGKEILYHVSNGTIVGFNVLEEKSGTLETWNSTTGQATIDGVVYPTNYLSDLSFQNNISDYLQKGVYFVTSGSSDYHPLLRITGFYYPGGKLEDFNADIYHATWLSKHGNAADMLEDKTPSEILIDVVSDGNGDLAIDLWRSFELVFDTLDDVTTLHDFAVKPRDMYSALILDALEASVSYDVVASEFEDNLKMFRECLSEFTTIMKTVNGIDLNNKIEFQNFWYTLDLDADAALEEFTNTWFKTKYPNISDISKSMKYISKGLKVVGTLEDFAEYCAACETLMNVSDSMKAVLERAYLKSAEVYGPNDNMTQAFNDCLQMITRSTDEMFDQIEKEAVAVVGKAGIKYLISNVLWKKVSDQIQISCPEVAILQLGYKTGKTISNQLCNTDDAAEKYLKMDYITDIESMIDVVYRDLEFDFDRDSTLDLAQEYLSAMKLSFRLRDVDCETAHSYVDNIQDSALGSLNELLGGSDYEGLKSAINRTKDEYAQHYTLSETDWIAHLEEDYPGSGLYELYSAIYEAIIGSGGNVKLVKQIIAACPVDVYVYDQSNNVVASVIDGRVSCSKDDVMIALVDNQKIIRFYDGADYRIEYIGYNTGDMDITITEFNGNENIQRTVNYYDLALTNGKTYSMDANDEILKPYDLVDKASNSTVQHDYDSLDTNAAHTIKIVSGTLQQSGELFAETTASKGETLQLNAYVPDGYEFVRWESSSANALIANINSVNTTLIMPDEDLAVTAIMRETSSPGATHTVTFNPNGGTVSLSTAITTPSGKLTTMPTPILSGYTFDGWFTLASGGEKITTDYIFTSDTMVYAHWTYVGTSSPTTPSVPSNPGGWYPGNYNPPASSYSVSAPSVTGGTVSVNPTSATAGSTVTITATPDAGYELTALTVNDANGKSLELTNKGDGKYSFKMPNGKVSLNAEFRPVSSEAPWNNPFTDISPSAWYYDAVKFVNQNGLMNGAGNGLFVPDAYLSRAMLAEILYNKKGRPAMPDGVATFPDVSLNGWYTNAVTWAYGRGIIKGYDNGLFGPGDDITREQLAVMLYRYAGSPVPPNLQLNFIDAHKVSSWAQDAMCWAVSEGVLSGKGNGILDPTGKATRAEAAQMLKNYLDK